MNEWLKNFQSSYGALANNPRPTGPKSSWMKGAAEKVASKSKMANLPANYKSTEAAAFKAADAAKGGMKNVNKAANQLNKYGDYIDAADTISQMASSDDDDESKTSSDAKEHAVA